MTAIAARNERACTRMSPEGYTRGLYAVACTEKRGNMRRADTSERASEYIAAVSSSELRVIVKFVRANLFCFSIDLRSTDAAVI